MVFEGAHPVDGAAVEVKAGRVRIPPVERLVRERQKLGGKPGGRRADAGDECAQLGLQVLVFVHARVLVGTARDVVKEALELERGVVVEAQIAEKPRARTHGRRLPDLILLLKVLGLRKGAREGFVVLKQPGSVPPVALRDLLTPLEAGKLALVHICSSIFVG